MSWERMTAMGPAGENRWSRWRRLLVPSLFFAGVIYYEELFLKLVGFQAVTAVGARFTLLFPLPIAILLGLLCGGVAPRKGRVLLPAMTLLLSVWMGAQSIYYHLFKTFLTAFSLTKMGMVAGAFGDMAVGEILLNWFPIAMMAVLGLLYTLLVEAFLHPLLLAFGATPDVMPYAVAYTRITALGMPLLIVTNAMSNLARADGSPKYSMTVLKSRGEHLRRR